MQVSELGAVCEQRGWSRSRLVHELRRAARQRGETLPGDDSLKRMIRLWVNGSRGVSPLYASLLSEVFQTSLDTGPPVRDSSTELVQRLVRSAQADAELVRLLEDQTDVLRGLDRRAGAAFLLSQTEGHVRHMSALLSAAPFGRDREALAAALAEAAALAGWQALDQGDTDRSWSLHAVARSAAQESEDVAVLAHVTAQQAYAVLDAGEPARAAAQVAHARAQAERKAPKLLRAWLAAAEAEMHAATGREAPARRALEDAAGHLDALDDVTGATLPYLSLDVSHLTRWRGHCLARLGSADAVDVLSRAVEQADTGYTRATASLHCDLGLAHLRSGDVTTAQQHADRAAGLATITSSTRQDRRIQRLRAAARSARRESQEVQEPHERA